MNSTLPITEKENPKTAQIDTASTLEAVRMLNNEDKGVPLAVEAVLPQVAEVIDRVVDLLENAGRLFYVGSGTSGRLGVLDASEIPPTFGVSYDLVQGIIAGGYDALYKATETSEDDHQAAITDLKSRGLLPEDAVIGIAASGRTPYTIGAVEYARSIGCFTAAVVCSPNSNLEAAAELAIVPLVGPEAITGSTRMKAGTAQKLILNMISTVAMIRLGYVSGNRMTNMKASNKKLRDRSLRILTAETGADEAASSELLAAADNDLRVALVMRHASVGRGEAERALNDTSFVVEEAVENLRPGK